MRFWDSSAIVPLLATQPATPVAEALLEGDTQLLVWWGASGECISAQPMRCSSPPLSKSPVEIPRA
jgi:hypothetical protein